MQRRHYIWVFILTVLVFGFTGCSEDGFFFRQEDPYTVIDRPGIPSARLLEKSTRLTYRSFKAAQDGQDLAFSLEYFLNSPEVDGVAVQATHLIYKANKLYISYNTEGEMIRGGMEIVDMLDPADPQVMATGIRDGEFSSLDIITRSLTGDSWLALVGAGMPLAGQPAPQVRLFELDGAGYPLSDPQIVDLHGFTGTDIQHLGLVSGTDGAFYRLDEQTLSFASLELDVQDARSVAWDPQSEQYVVLNGDPVQLITNLPGQPVVHELGVSSLTSGAKAIVRIWNGLAFVAMGEHGLNVYDLETGDQVAGIARPDIPEGENSQNFVTNGVSVHEESYVFIANGAAGVFVARYTDGNLELLGSIDLDASVNYVEASGDYLFAATGAKGVAIIYMGGVNGPDPLVTTDPVLREDVLAFSARGGGSVNQNGGSPILNKGICWSDQRIPTTSDPRTNHGPGEGSFVSDMTGLDAETTYYVRAFATTEKKTFYGEVVTFTTAASDQESGTLTDSRDGQTYTTVTIGQTIWMAENLSWLPSVSPVASGSLIDPYYYVYGYNGFSTQEARLTSSYLTYGVLYNWTAAQSACPAGWRLPSDADWQELERHFGMSSDDAMADRFRNTGSVGEKLKTTSGWMEEGNGSDIYGFGALPSGYRARGGEFRYQGSYAPFWTADEQDNLATYRGLYYYNDGVYRADWYKTAGFAVRCVKEN